MMGDISSGINDYFALTLEQKLNRDKIKLSLTLGAEFDNLFDAATGSDLWDQKALFIFSSLIISVKENVECSLGAFWAIADDNTTFNSADFSTLAYLSVKVKI